MKERLLEMIEVVPGVIQGDFHTANLTTTWVNLKNYAGCLVVVTLPAGTTGDDILLTLQQATDVLGTGAKTLNITSFYAKVGTLSQSQTGVPTFTRYDLTTPETVATASVTGNSYTGSGLATAISALSLNSGAFEKMFVIPVDPDALDTTNGFHTIAFFNTAANFNNAIKGNVTFIPYGARFPGQIPLSAITA